MKCFLTFLNKQIIKTFNNNKTNQIYIKQVQNSIIIT